MSDKSGKSIKELVDEAIADGKLTRAEHQRLRDAMIADGTIDDEEFAQMQRIMDLIDAGKIQVLDE